MQSQYENLTVRYQEVATSQNECFKEKAIIYKSKMECMVRVNKYEDLITVGLGSKLKDLRYMFKLNLTSNSIE